LAFYRDWHVLLTASTVVAADHFVRGLFWPESVYGTALASPWRFAEHAGWVVVEDIFLIIACQQGLREMLEVAQRQANLEVTNKHLSGANGQLRAEIEQHQRTQQELEIARDTAEAANRAKSEFLANMSHELRTPLNAIIGFSDVLSEQVFGPLNENQQQYVTDVLDSGQHLLSLVNDILDLAKVESGAMEVEWKVLQLPALIERTLQMFRERAMRHGVRLQAELPPDLGEVAVDERRLKQLLYNFLSNALKFTPEGGEINVRARCTAEHVTISVADTGVGIAPAEQQKIFDTFYQVDSSLTKSQQGTGLGLTLVRKIAELHEGRVWVESEPGYGSEFFFQWPRRQAVDHAEGQADVFASTFGR
jgi:signal transduction histidine kinase